MINQLRLHRRAVLLSSGLLVGLLALIAVLAGAISLTRSASGPARSTTNPNSGSPDATRQAGTSSTAVASTPASDAASWNAIPSVTAAASGQYPAITTAAAGDPDTFVRAFITELFNGNYRAAARGQLLAWAQYEDAPLRSPNYPPTDWTKVLVDSLTDLTWDAATDTPVPTLGSWLALRSERAVQSVSNIKTMLDPQWEDLITGGYQPPDPLATIRDVTATLTQRTSVGARTAVSTYSIAIDVQLGTSGHGGYGVATTNNYVITKVS